MMGSVTGSGSTNVKKESSNRSLSRMGQNFIPIYLAVLFGPLAPFFHLIDIPFAPACSTPLAFVFYIICSYMITRLTGLTRWGMAGAMVAVGVTMLVSIVVSAITVSIISAKLPFAEGIIGLGPLTLPVLVVLIPAAFLGGMIGSSLSRWRWRTARSEPV